MKEAPLIPIRDLIIFPGIITPVFVGREKSIRTLEQALIEENQLVLFLQKEKTKESPVLPKDIHEIGVLVNILQTVKMPNGNIKVLVEAKQRVKLIEITEKKDYYKTKFDAVIDEIVDEEKAEALKRKVMNTFEKYAKVTNKILPDLIINLKGIKNISKIFDLISSNMLISTEDKQSILQIEKLEERGYRLLEILSKEVEIVGLEKKIDTRVKDQMNSIQKNYYLKEKIKAMREELGEASNTANEMEQIKEDIKKAKFPKYVKDKLIAESEKLSKMPPFSSEASVIRTYIDIVSSLPWNKKTKDILEIKKANKILEEDHYGLKKVKERILEFLAVKKLNKSMKGSILCLVGPPGVGKTSLAKSIARSMGRNFARISLGGIKDEAEIRGHRKTYVGSMPGRIIKEVKRVGSKNPLILLDEIDKMAMDFRGDPSSALLEVLDSEQNKEFEDHYIDMPFDISDTFFIATANDLGAIPAPLRDRMEIIMLSSYTEYEKFHIAKKYLIDKSKIENGVSPFDISLTDKTVSKIINEYTREAGVRSLKRELDKIFRRVAKEIVEENITKIAITVKNLKKYLGNAKFRPDKMKEKAGKIGVVNGLAWTSVGGTTLEVQAVKMAGKGNLTLTGKLGDVMKESAKVAYSYIRSQKDVFNIEDKFDEKYELHLHFPEGAVPKDGPSAGITITTALLSVLCGKKVRQNIAMTGEITITGEVLPVGGIKEKMLGAHRVGIREVILPLDNKVDTEELPKEILKDMKFYFAETYDDVKDLVFAK